MSRWRTIWKVVTRNYRYRSKSLSAGIITPPTGGGRRQANKFRKRREHLKKLTIEYCEQGGNSSRRQPRLTEANDIRHRRSSSATIKMQHLTRIKTTAISNRRQISTTSILALAEGTPIIYEIVMRRYVILRPQSLSGRLRRRLVPKTDHHHDLANFNGYSTASSFQ